MRKVESHLTSGRAELQAADTQAAVMMLGVRHRAKSPAPRGHAVGGDKQRLNRKKDGAAERSPRSTTVSSHWSQLCIHMDTQSQDGFHMGRLLTVITAIIQMFIPHDPH